MFQGPEYSAFPQVLHEFIRARVSTFGHYEVQQNGECVWRTTRDHGGEEYAQMSVEDVRLDHNDPHLVRLGQPLNIVYTGSPAVQQVRRNLLPCFKPLSQFPEPDEEQAVIGYACDSDDIKIPIRLINKDAARYRSARQASWFNAVRHTADRMGGRH